MFDMIVIASVVFLAVTVTVILGRTLAARFVQSRDERLKAHLDWINPIPQTSRRRGLQRR